MSGYVGAPALAEGSEAVGKWGDRRTGKGEKIKQGGEIQEQVSSWLIGCASHRHDTHTYLHMVGK